MLHRRVVPVFVAAVMLTLPSCYTHVPVESATPPMGERFTFEISDQGRVDLAERIGPGIARIEGRLVGMENDQYLVSVNRVVSISGESSGWSGETIRLDRGIVSRLRERQLSRTRTAAVAAGVTAALVAIVLTTDLEGLFTGDDDEIGPIEPPPTDFRPGKAVRPINK